MVTINDAYEPPIQPSRLGKRSRWWLIGSLVVAALVVGSLSWSMTRVVSNVRPVDADLERVELYRTPPPRLENDAPESEPLQP